jgi:hypothetical protein
MHRRLTRHHPSVATGDQPRFLHRSAAYGLTTNPVMAAPGEPEALSRDDSDDMRAVSERRARERQAAQWAERRRAITRELDWLRSQRFHRYVRSDVRALERQLDRLDRKLTR